MDDDYAYRFEYADKSAFQVYEDGRAFIVYKDGRREERFGKIHSRIRLLVGKAAKPPQDEIDRLREAISWMENLDPQLVDAAREKFLTTTPSPSKSNP